MAVKITKENQKHLRRPFTAAAVKFRIDGKPKNGKVRCLTYIDSRLATERLTEVDPDWTSSYEFPGKDAGDPLGMRVALPVVCNLTIKGVTRQGTGQIAGSAVDDKHFKSASSDALKRAGVEFGLGAYLYTLGNTYLDVDKHTSGQGKYINAAGQKYLRDQYNKAISTKEFKARFGEPIDYGDQIPNQGDGPTEAEADAEVAPAATADDVLTPEQKQKLVVLSVQVGASSSEAEKLADNTKPGRAYERRITALEKRVKEKQVAEAAAETETGMDKLEAMVAAGDIS